LQAIIITADQIVLYNGVVREKPQDKKQAHEFLLSYANKSAQTVSAIVVHNTATEMTSGEVEIASVKFNDIPGSFIS
jgi:septum formation protein